MTERRKSPTKRLSARRIYWIGVAVWALFAALIGDRVAQGMKFRVNDLSVIPGAGMVMRDPEGTFFHVDSLGRSRSVFPELGPAEHKELCLDCVLVTGEQLSKTNEFCASGVRNSLPKLEFELPCHSWAVMGDGPKVVSVTLFLIPILLWPVLRAVARAITGVKPG